MSYPINQNVKPYPQQHTGVSDKLQNVNIDGQKLKDGINDNPVSKMTEQTNPYLYAGIFIPTAALTYLGMNRFGDACRGEYGKTLLGKLDNFDSKIRASKVIDNPVIGGVKKGVKGVVNFVDKWFITKLPILNAFFHTPAMPENKMALTQMKGISADIATSATSMFESYTKNGTEIEKIKKLLPELANEADEVVVKKYKDIVENAYKHVDKIEEICKNMGTEAATKIEHGGKIPFSKWFNKTFKKIDVPTYLTDLYPNSKFIQKTFARTVHFDEYANKIKASRKGLSRVLLQVIEGLTNAGSGAAGGGAIFAAVMGAWFLVDAITRTIKAPNKNGEKRKTFMENMLYNIGFYITIPIATKTMHAFGGLRYIGMKKENVIKYREMVKDLNNRVDANKYHAKLEVLNNKLNTQKITQEGYNNALKALKEKFKRIDIEKTPTITKGEYVKRAKVLNRMKKGSTRIKKNDKFFTKVGKFFTNIVRKPLKWFFDKIYMTGNEFKKPFVAKDASEFVKGLKNVQFKLKDFSAYPVRMALFMFLFAPLFAKFFAKGSHLVFGKPEKSVLDEGKEEPKPAQAQPTATQPSVVAPQPAAAKPNATVTTQTVQQPQAMVKPTANNTTPKNMTPFAKESLLDKYNKNHQSVMTQSTASQKTMVPQEPVRRYIPGTNGVKIQPGSEQDQQNKKYNDVMGKADKAERIANQYL